MTLICLSSDDSSEIILLESFLVKFGDFLVFIYKDAKINVVDRKKTERQAKNVIYIGLISVCLFNLGMRLIFILIFFIILI